MSLASDLQSASMSKPTVQSSNQRTNMTHQLSRRAFIHRAILTSAAAVSAGSLSAVPNPPNRLGGQELRNCIDAHAQVWSPDLARYPLAPPYTKEALQPPSFTPQELFTHSKPAGVNRFNLVQARYYGFDNSYMLDMIKQFEDVFVGTALVNPNDPGVVKLMGEQAKQRVRAYRIHPGLVLRKGPVAVVPRPNPPGPFANDRGRIWLQDPCYDRMFEAGAKNNQAMSCWIFLDALPDLDRKCRKFPETPVIIDHLCRVGTSGKITDADVDDLCRMAQHKRVMVKVGAFYTLGKRTAPYTDLGPLILRVVKAFGANRCMWESDCPTQLTHGTYQDSIDLIRRELDFFSVGDRDWILRKTAENFFFKNQKVGA